MGSGVSAYNSIDDALADGKTQEEIDSTMKNQAPGAPKLSILPFKGGFHGRTVGLLSCSNSRPIHGVDIPVLPWPKADFPRYVIVAQVNRFIQKTQRTKLA